MLTTTKTRTKQAIAIQRKIAALDFTKSDAQSKGSASFGPFDIAYTASGDKIQVSVRVKVGPINKKIASATLTPKKAAITGGASAELIKVKIALNATFTGERKLAARAEICHKQISKLRFKWKCKKIASAKIVSW